jgi:hypothetical protein
MLTSARTPLAPSDENVVGNGTARTTRLRTRPHAAGGGGRATIDPTQVSKTPAAAAASSSLELTGTATTKNKSRRALGDISNRKSSRTNGNATAAAKAVGGAGGGSGATTKPIRVVVAPKQPAAKAVSFAMDVESEIGDDFINKGGSRAAAPTTPHPSKLQQQQRVEFDFDEDVEMPAGRLWVDQKWLDDDDGASVELSLEGAATAREDLMEALAERHRLRLEREDAADDKALRAVEDDLDNLLRSGASVRKQQLRMFSWKFART